MRYRLSDAVHLCPFDKTTVVLTVREDRYFLVAGELNRALWNALKGLDLPASDAEMVEGLIDQGVLQVHKGDAPPPDVQVVAQSDTVLTMPPAISSGWSFPLIFAGFLRTVREVKRRPLCDIIDELGELKNRAAGQPRELSDTLEAASRISAVMRLANLIMGADHLCLPRSIFVTRFLLSRGFSPKMVMAVTERPFQAHCWAQLDDLILTDTPDHVAAFKPIFVL